LVEEEVGKILVEEGTRPLCRLLVVVAKETLYIAKETLYIAKETLICTQGWGQSRCWLLVLGKMTLIG